jgi:hypothetical protein
MAGYLGVVTGLSVTTREFCDTGEAAFRSWQDAATMSLGLGVAVVGGGALRVVLRKRGPMSGHREVKR